MAKEILFNADVRSKMKSGADALANAVKVTLGPKGRNVVIEKKLSTRKQPVRNFSKALNFWPEQSKRRLAPKAAML